jgi:hypothetical protein
MVIMTFPLAQQSLTGLSQAAAELWDLLTHSQTVEEEAELLAAIWENQEAQIDLHAELAFQLDAEIAGVKQRLEHLKALEFVTSWYVNFSASLCGQPSSQFFGR